MSGPVTNDSEKPQQKKMMNNIHLKHHGMVAIAICSQATAFDNRRSRHRSCSGNRFLLKGAWPLCGLDANQVFTRIISLIS
jgi:hypothetical protein